MNWKTTSEDINYKPSPSGYVWGTLNPDLVTVAERANINGAWLNLAAGDGRYNELLIDKCESLTAFDLDKNALDRLVEHIPPSQREKIELAVGDLTNPLPFSTDQFDGCLSTGILHLFHEAVLHKIFAEIFRILQPQASFIMDFAVDIEREYADGSLHIIEGEPQYTLDEGQRFLGDIFRDMHYEFRVGTVPDFPVNNFDRQYIFRCSVLSVLAILP